ncbi:hypothetical protein DASB73_018410 [Starmerella bacillaris]|uniref:Uncharacterized protein n=1 Tax=Starmerella bacillaris TaxID=1247836 RepID=A0AAV5RHE8_STABA|nr:hypothetical protein DASB73_018410 [Starmerella bacillaris]
MNKTKSGLSLAAQVAKTLEQKDVLKTYKLLHEYTQYSKPIPPNAMKSFYDVVKEKNDVFHTHLLSKFVTVEAVGEDDFIVYFNRLIQLYLMQGNYIHCLAFIRTVEYINKGEVSILYYGLEMLVKSAKYQNDIATAQEAVQVMVDNDSKINSRTWGMLLQLALDTDNYDSIKYIYKNALATGYLVPDDASYLRIANLAARQGDTRVCEWTALRMRRRQQAVALSKSRPAPDSQDSAISELDRLNIERNHEDALELYTCLIEAAAVSSIKKKDKYSATMRAVFRYLGRLGHVAQQLSVRQLPNVVKALNIDDNLENGVEFFSALCSDASAPTDTKLLVLNLLIACMIQNEREGIIEVCELAARNQLKLNSESNGLLAQISKTDRRLYERVRIILPQHHTCKN